MRVFAIDPGNKKSAYCVIDADTLRPLDFGKIGNEELLEYIQRFRFEKGDHSAVEMVASYGMSVGAEVFETVYWIGRFCQCLTEILPNPPTRVFRMQEKMHICDNSRAKDTNIRIALIDRFAKHDKKAGKGTKRDPDWFYGFAADVWTAYAVGLTFIETEEDTT